jgi:hypothetical protein
MKVQTGIATVADAASELVLSRKHYYRLEVKMMSAALAAVTPGKRGPRTKFEDPKISELEEQVETLQRDKRLLEIQLEESRHVVEEMKLRLAQSEEKRGKKSRRKRARPSVRRILPAARAVSGGETEMPGETHGRPL